MENTVGSATGVVVLLFITCTTCSVQVLHVMLGSVTSSSHLMPSPVLPALEGEYWRGQGSRLGLKFTAEQISRAADRDDVFCNAIITRFEERLARALASVINVLDPEVIVLGGGLSNMTRLYRNVPHLWARHVFSDQVATRLVPPMHGDSSGVRGAAWLWP